MLIFIMVVAAGTQVLNSGLGMGFGPIVMSFVIGMGLSPLVAVATVNLANTGVSLVSGAAHYRFGNVHWPTVLRLAVPGAIAAFLAAIALGALAFSSTSSPVTNLVLLCIGGVILWRFGYRRLGPPRFHRDACSRLTVPAGLAGGAVAASTGLGWGAVPLSVLTNSAKLPPRKIVGSVAASETVVAAAAVAGFLIAIPIAELLLPLALGIFLTGALIAPFGAWLARKLPATALGASIGALLLAFNGTKFFIAVAAPLWLTITVLVLCIAVWGVGLWRILRVPTVHSVPAQRTSIPTASAATRTVPQGEVEHSLPLGRAEQMLQHSEPVDTVATSREPISDLKPATERESALMVGTEKFNSSEGHGNSQEISASRNHGTSQKHSASSDRPLTPARSAHAWEWNGVDELRP